MLTCLSELPFVPHDYQIQTAHKVLYEMGCRALIADEVGLGKTIEAGLIVKELMSTGRAQKILILTPASLVQQWWEELNNKFKMNFWVSRKGPWAWSGQFVISSIEKAKRDEHRELIMQNEYDLVIIDEAHKLKNRKTSNWTMVSQLRTRGLVLLTATPLHNKVEELYNLVSLLKPELFRDYDSFLEFYQLNPKALISELKDKLQDVMIRNMTRELGVKNINRRISLIPVELSDLEKEIYRRIRLIPGSFLPLTLCKEFCSSLSALYDTLYKKGEFELLPLLEECEISPKLTALDAILRAHKGKVLVFTEYIQTQHYIARFLNDKNIKFLLYNGTLKRNQKEWVKSLFEQRDIPVMICTDSGSQGLNFQYCDVIVNFDLPWNPMKVEQRIGRIDRLGQQAQNVYIYNFVMKDTLEEKIFSILGEKISLFKECIGELNNILADNDEELYEMIGRL
ncbi:MAG: SNF2-related protein [Thermincola sp.]|nr:SNF2-related protein [Thermincola sp.]MDT3703187.1 SNF2-related protein [Thermincola sp.]